MSLRRTRHAWLYRGAVLTLAAIAVPLTEAPAQTVDYGALEKL